MKIETDEYIVTFKDDQAARDALFDAVVNLFKKKGSFSGECIVQSDWASIDSPEFLGDLADNILQFDVRYKDE